MTAARRLAAILAADVAGYSRLIGADEEGTLGRLKAIRAELIDPKIARLEALAEPGGICVSARVQEDAAGRLDLAFEDLGEQSLKNIARTVRVYRLRPQSPHPNPPPPAGEGASQADASTHPPPQAGEG